MGSHSAKAAIPDTLRSGFQTLVARNIVVIVEQLHLEEKTGTAHFEFEVGIPFPNKSGLGGPLRFEASVPHTYPLGKIRFKPSGSEPQGFPHQASATLGGELCLLDEHKYPRTASDTLVAYIQSVIDWAIDAAGGSLLKAGQRWELPDFRLPSRRQSTLKTLFSETAEGLAHWQHRVGQSGTAHIAVHSPSTIAVVKFDFVDGNFYEPIQNTNFVQNATTHPVSWVLLSGILYVRHRAASSFSELAELFQADGLDLWKFVRKAIRGVIHGYHVILVGFVITEIVGGPATEVHWQPVAIPESQSLLARPYSRKRKGAPKRRDRLKSLLLDEQVPWGISVNVSPNRLRARASSSRAVPTSIAVVGCGALGSSFVDHLAREYIGHLALFDSDTFEIQNISRHVLDVRDIGRNKAIALAERLRGVNPETSIVGFGTDVPFVTINEITEAAQSELDACDSILDCSTNEQAFEYLSSVGRRSGRRVIHGFINANAKMLTVCMSGRHVSCERVLARFVEDVRSGVTSFTWQEYDATVEAVDPGAGCWLGTFPARGVDIAALVASAHALINEFLTRHWSSKGRCIVLSRHDVSLDACRSQPPIEVVWNKTYR